MQTPMRHSPSTAGYTLIELMFVVTLVAILTAVGISTYYQQYLKKAYYSEVVQLVSTYQKGIAECYHDTNNLSLCRAGEYRIPDAITAASSDPSIQSLTISGNGVITVVPVARKGIKTSDTLILTPLINATTNRIHWSITGGAVSEGYVSTNVIEEAILQPTLQTQQSH